MRALWVLITAGFLTATSPASGALIIPDCAGTVEIAAAHIVRVDKNGDLILGDGHAALLEGIRLPQDGALADQALAQLRRLALNGPLTLTAVAPKQDRYGRIRVQAFAASGEATLWLQMELLKAGLAQVQISPDRNECAPDFYESEEAARQNRSGLWAESASAPRRPEGLAGDMGRFTIVEGRVSNVGRRDGRMVLDFEGGRGFTVTVAQEDLHPFRDFDPPLDDLVGKRIRLRGIVQMRDGHPDIALSNPAQIEVLN